MRAADRESRDARVLQLFVGGATYRHILAQLRLDQDKPEGWALKSVSQIHKIVERELASSAQRRTLLTDEAYALHQERTERLFAAHWPKALQGDHRSAEICRRILAQQGRLYGLDGFGSSGGLPAPTPTGPMLPDHPGEDQPDELEQLRRSRANA